MKECSVKLHSKFREWGKKKKIKEKAQLQHQTDIPRTPRNKKPAQKHTAEPG
jgi:hypothetical protein